MIVTSKTLNKEQARRVIEQLSRGEEPDDYDEYWDDDEDEDEELEDDSEGYVCE